METKSACNPCRAENLALILSFAIPLVIYLLLPARRFLPDGVVNVTFGSQERIKLGLKGFLLLPTANHYLFELFAMIWAKMLNGFSSSELLRSFQTWSALFGACGAALTYALARRALNISIFHSLTGALTLGFLGSWWRYSHDVETIIFPQIFSIATFYMTISALRTEGSAKARWAAIFLALAVWTHQINAIIVLPLILLILLYKAKRPFKVKMIKLFFIWGFFISLLFSLPHLISNGITDTFRWLSGAGSMGLWGKGFSFENIRTFGKFLYGSIAWLRTIAGGVGFNLLLLFALIALATNYRLAHTLPLALWAFLTLIFAFWWEPQTPEFMTPALVPLVILASEGFESSNKHDILSKFQSRLIAILLFIYIFTLNFIHVAVINRDLEHFESYRLSKEYAGIVSENSLLFSPTFDWETTYLKIYASRESRNLFAMQIQSKAQNRKLIDPVKTEISIACSDGKTVLISGLPASDSRYKELEKVSLDLKQFQRELEALGIERAFSIRDRTYYTISCPSSEPSAKPRL